MKVPKWLQRAVIWLFHRLVQRTEEEAEMIRLLREIQQDIVEIKERLGE